MLERFRRSWTALLAPVADALLRAGVSPDVVTLVGTLGVIVAALYLLWAYQRVFHGPAEGANAEVADMTRWEIVVMLPLLAGILFLGIYPKPVLERIEPAVEVLIVQLEAHSDYREPDGAGPPEAEPAGAAGGEGHG